MAYSLEFKPSALKEWEKLDNTVRIQKETRESVGASKN